MTEFEHVPEIDPFGTASILGREPIEVARKILYAAKRHGPVEAYIDGRGRVTLRVAGVVYPTEPPSLWLVGLYTDSASTIRIMEDVELRVAEVRAARG